MCTIIYSVCCLDYHREAARGRNLAFENAYWRRRRSRRELLGLMCQRLEICLTRYGLSTRSFALGGEGATEATENEKNGRKHTKLMSLRRLIRPLYLYVTYDRSSFSTRFFHPFPLNPPHPLDILSLSVSYCRRLLPSSATQHIWTRPSKLRQRPTISTTKEAGKKKGKNDEQVTFLRRRRQPSSSAIHPAECKTYNIMGTTIYRRGWTTR
jgi:hypothetical protein